MRHKHKILWSSNLNNTGLKGRKPRKLRLFSRNTHRTLCDNIMKNTHQWGVFPQSTPRFGAKQEGIRRKAKQIWLDHGFLRLCPVNKNWGAGTIVGNYFPGSTKTQQKGL